MIPRDKQHILNPDGWSNWPLLPMVNRKNARGIPPTGLIIGDPVKDQVFFVPGANLWAVDDEFNKKNGSMRDIDEILAEGWMVD